MKQNKNLRLLAISVFCVCCLVFSKAGTGGIVKAAEAGVVVNSAIAGSNVNVILSASKAPASDDGMLYLFAEPMYSDAITTNAVASAPAAENAAFSCPLNLNKSDSKLYSKFIVAAVRGGQYVPLNTGSYITNPEAVASNTVARTVTASKKGLLVDPAHLTDNELKDLGVKNAIYNVPLSNLIGPTTNGSYPTVNYSYNGKNYQFNGLVVAEYDHVFGTLSGKGMSVTACLLNNSNGRAPHMIHPLARDGFPCPYYMYNNAEQAGVEQIAATAAFLAERYSNKGHGKVDNWIIANEISARTEWNYVNIGDLATYVNEYAEGFRLFYNGIKSKNANANVYLCIDQQWDRNRNEAGKYDSKDLIDEFNKNISAGGNIDWGLACHPHPLPLTEAAFWRVAPYYRSLLKHDVRSAYVTMENIEVITDYFCTPALLSPTGRVRSIICSEVGYTSAQGEDIQAAAFVYGYLQAANNQYIDAFMLSRETDMDGEIAQGLAYGLSHTNHAHKMIYDFYKNIDTGNAGPFMDSAKAIIGIADWSQVIHAR